MQELERRNTVWQSENVKLFQDNRRLAQTLQAEKEQSENTIASLENQIRSLHIEKAAMVKQNESLKARPTQTPSDQKLLTDYYKLHAFYSGALNEIHQLRDYIDRIGPTNQHPPQQALTDHVPYATTSSSMYHNGQTSRYPQSIETQTPGRIWKQYTEQSFSPQLASMSSKSIAFSIVLNGNLNTNHRIAIHSQHVIDSLCVCTWCSSLYTLH